MIKHELLSELASRAEKTNQLGKKYLLLRKDLEHFKLVIAVELKNRMLGMGTESWRLADVVG